MNPTAEQLANRLNPTPVTLNTPTGEGLFKGTTDYGSAIYKRNADGTYSYFDVNELAKSELTKGQTPDQYGNYSVLASYNSGAQASYGLDYLKKTYGFDYNSLPSYNLADTFGYGAKSSKYVGDFSSFSGTPQNISTQSTVINNTPNAIATPAQIAEQMKNPLWNSGAGKPLPDTSGATGLATGVATGTAVGGATATVPAPQTQPISNPVTAPTVNNVPAPVLPQPQGAAATETYVNSLTGQIEGLKTQIEAEAAKRAAEYEVKIKAFEQEEADMKDLQEDALGGIDEATKTAVAEKKAALELEKQRFDENYNANQALIGELDALLTEGNALVKQMQETTGLASIMNPRISKTMSDVAARSGVIQAVLSARNGQMSYAQQQLGTTYDALSSILNDETNYYKTVIDFYEMQSDDSKAERLTLTGEQKDYLDVKLNMLSNELTRLEETKEIISKAMLDPDTASTFGAAGITLNDSPEVISKKLNDYAYSQELVEKSNTMSTNGYGSVPQPGVQPTWITDSRGNQKAWYKIPVAGSSTVAKLTEVSPGATLFDPATGKPVYTAPTAATTTAQAEGNGYTQAEIDQLNANYEKMKALGIPVTKTWPDSPTSGASTGKALTTVGFPPNTTQADITGIDNALKTGTLNGQKIPTSLSSSGFVQPMGANGYVDPTGYVTMMDFWIKEGGTKESFFNKFPYKDYIDPANTWVWGYLGIKNPYVKATDGRSA